MATPSQILSLLAASGGGKPQAPRSLLGPQDRADSLNAGLFALASGLMESGKTVVGAQGLNNRPSIGSALLGFQQAAQQSRGQSIQQALLLKQLEAQQQTANLSKLKFANKLSADQREIDSDEKARTFLFGSGADPDDESGLSATSGLIDNIPESQRAGIRAIAEVSPQKAAEVGTALLKTPNMKLRNAGGRVLGINPQTGDVIKDFGAADQSGLASIADAFSKALGKGEARQQTKAAQEVRDKAASVRSFARMGRQAFNVLKKEGGNVQNIAAGIARIGQGIKSQTDAIFSSTKNDFSAAMKSAVAGDEEELKKFDFGRLASQSARYKSTMLRMAVMKARVDETGRLSDQDIERALKEIGASASSPQEAIAAMAQSMQNSVERFELEVEESLGPDIRKRVPNLLDGKFRKRLLKDLGPDLTPFVFGGARAAVPAQTQQSSPGVITSPGGLKLRRVQ